MMLSEAKTYHTYARECLKLAEEADEPNVRKKLIELSQTWMQAALTEEKNHSIASPIATRSSTRPRSP